MVKSGAEPCRERQSSNIYIFVLFLGARLCGFYLRDILLCPKLVCESFRRRDCTIWALANLHHRRGPEVGGEATLQRWTSMRFQIWLWFVDIISLFFMPYIFVSVGEEEIAELGVWLIISFGKATLGGMWVLYLFFSQRVIWARALCACERARRGWVGGGARFPPFCPKVFEDCTIWALAQSAPTRWSGSWRRGDVAKINFDAIPNMALVRRVLLYFLCLYFS